MQRTPSRMPGAWLLAVARLVFSASVLTTVVDQTVADMRAEWLAAGTKPSGRLAARCRGYFAFWKLTAISPFAFRDWQDPRDAHRMLSDTQRRTHMTYVKQFWLVAALLVVGLLSGYAVSRMQPLMYRASALIQRVPARVTAGSAAEAAIRARESVGARLLAASNLVLSRTRLERFILDFHLYEREREHMIMEDVVQLMRSRLSFKVHSGESFSISYTGSHPETVKNVTDRIAAIFVDESLKHRTDTNDGTLSFLEARIQETGHRLEMMSAELKLKGGVSRPKQLELEVMETSYKNLLTQREDALAMRDLERRQIGEQFVLLDAAQVPTRPFEPNRLRFMLMGGAVGIGMAALILLAAFVGRILRDRRQKLSAATA